MNLLLQTERRIKRLRKEKLELRLAGVPVPPQLIKDIAYLRKVKENLINQSCGIRR